MERLAARPGLRRAPSLDEAFNPRRNSLNALRLIFAATVIVSHAWPIGGFGPDPMLGDLNLGQWALAGFFIISGYLITASRSNNRFGVYLWRRCLRIFPALWICLLVTVVVFVSIALEREGAGAGSELGARVSYFVTNAVLVPDHLGVVSTPNDVPLASQWNDSLWTLFYEFACYLGVGVALTVALLRRKSSAFLITFAIFAALNLIEIEIWQFPWFKVASIIKLGAYFVAGALIYVYRRHLPLSGWLAGLSAALLTGGVLVGHVSAFAALPLAYLCLWLAVRLPLSRVGSKNDISYGMYIYAFPLAQILVLFGAQKAGVGWFILFCIALTLPFAWASWILVERPALALKRTDPRGLLQTAFSRLTRRRAAPTGPDAAE